MSARSCPSCSSDNSKEIYTSKYVLPDGHPLRAEIRIVTCVRCGFGFNDTPCTIDEYDRYYREVSKYSDPQLSTGSGAKKEDLSRLIETAKEISEFNGSRECRILDVGCGAGGLLDCLSNVGFMSLAGMDPAPACAAEVARRGHRSIVGTLNNHPINDGSFFGGIILSHVLEHVLDVKSALGILGRLLENNGWLYIEVPDAERYAEFMVAPYQDFNIEHINHFTAGSLNNLLCRQGWRVIKEGRKILKIEGDLKYPALYVFSQKVSQPIESCQQNEYKHLLEYISKSEEAIECLERKILSKIGDRKIIVWGAGQFTMRLLGETSLGRMNICAFVDNNSVYHGRKIMQRPIVAPRDLSLYADSGVPIIIGSLVNMESIENTIRMLGFANPIIRMR
jgi:SAM-dependent methyltransferase